MTISTHVLDTSAGRPGARIQVRLQRRGGASWATVAEATTNADGRVAALLPRARCTTARSRPTGSTLVASSERDTAVPAWATCMTPRAKMDTTVWMG